MATTNPPVVYRGWIQMVLRVAAAIVFFLALLHVAVFGLDPVIFGLFLLACGLV